MTAIEILEEAELNISKNAQARDSESAGGERSMRSCVEAFNALTGHQLTETEGWKFMVLLKLARARKCGVQNDDDYIDGAAYFALAGESNPLFSKKP